MRYDYRSKWPSARVAHHSLRIHLRWRVAQTVVRVAAPGVHAALREKAFVEPLPAETVRLHNGLVWHAEGGAGGMAPIVRVEADVRLLEGSAGAAEGEETPGVQVGEDQNEDVDGKLPQAYCCFGHLGVWKEGIPLGGRLDGMYSTVVDSLAVAYKR